MRKRTRRIARGAVIVGLVVGISSASALAQPAEDFWNPFKWGQKPPAEPKKEPPANRAKYQSGPRSGPVESTDLAPVLTRDATGLPLELWRGLDLAALEKAIAALDLPPRSPALQQVWRRMLLSSATLPQGTTSPDDFLVLRQEALYRSGLVADMGTLLDGMPSATPLARVLRARVDIGLGSMEAGCQAIKVLPPISSLPARLKGEALVLGGLCAASSGDPAGASLAASIAREEGVGSDFTLAVLSGIEGGARSPLPARVSLIDYRLLEAQGAVDTAQLLQKAEPALLVALAGAAKADVRLRTAAAEAALRLNAIAPQAVADIYRQPPEVSGSQIADKHGDALQRARLFRAIESAPSAEVKARHIRTLLDDAKRAGLYLQTANMLLPSFAHQWPSQETSAFAEAAVQVALAAGDLDVARRWAESAASLQHWLALIDFADPTRQTEWQAGLLHLDTLAARGRLDAVVLHRLATILAGLDVNVPVGIWEAASRAPQPAGGHLPETGVLAELSQISQRREAGHTVLVVIRALGPRRADELHMLTLGDTVRALKRAGLEADARRFGLEALLPVWPRVLGR
jgi:hypothetical protein